MDLFRRRIDEPENLLTKEGVAKYYGTIIPLASANDYYHHLLKGVEWKNDEAIIYGKHITTKRKVAWYGDEAFGYTYSNVTKYALPWTGELLQLKSVVEDTTGESFNACLLNLYSDGSEGMAWHSDGELDLKKNGAIASLSFGAERRFSFRHIETKTQISLMLEHGSLLVMSGSTQVFWQHRLPLMKRIIETRINLTFRSIIKD